jgi:hypothetical protein
MGRSKLQIPGGERARHEFVADHNRQIIFGDDIAGRQRTKMPLSFIVFMASDPS